MAEALDIAPSHPPRIVAGLEPTPTIHLGHYIGSIRDLIRLQHEYPGDTFYVVADYHALARGIAGDKLRQDTVELVTALLALGLDPNKTILYRQSDIPACAELVWYVSCLVPSSELARYPTYLKMLESAEGPSAGALLYPLLMAADVLCLRGTQFQVDRDERLNAEVVRDIAGKLNRFFGWEVFPLPQVRYSDEGVVPGSDGRKMSLADGNYIGLFEPFYSLQEQVRNIATDSEDSPPPETRESSTVYRLYSLVAGREDALEMAEELRHGNLGHDEAKRRLTQALQERFVGAEEQYHKLKRDPDFVLDVLREGVRQAREEARRTLGVIRDLLGLAA